ncbi:MAG: TVP38/TMEM64 family protein [Rhodocyclales bacterium]|nr:TVP38/TMEM64 family protein [Rhodocyclales bacterium]
MLASALLVAGLYWLLRELGGELSFSSLRSHHDDFLRLVDTHPVAAILLTFLLHTLLAALALPGASLLMLAAGSGFGAALGTLLCLSGCTAGATLAMLASRHWLEPVVRRRYTRQLDDFDARVAADGTAYLFSLRLLPVLPFVVVNLAAGLTPMKTWTFIWVSFVGMAAGTFVYVNAGTALGHVRELADLHSPGVLASLLALALLPWLAKLLTRRRADKASP